jgi:hypothetical protein
VGKVRDLKLTAQLYLWSTFRIGRDGPPFPYVFKLWYIIQQREKFTYILFIIFSRVFARNKLVLKYSS